MKITEVRTRVVQWEGKTVPLPPHFCTNPMDLVSYRAASMGNFAFHGWVLVEIFTDSGLVGLGNAALSPVVTKSLIDTYLKPILLDADPWDIEFLWQQMYRRTMAFGRKGVALTAISAVGTVSGFVGFGGAIGGAIFGIVAGYLLSHGFGYGTLFVLVGTFHLIGFLAIILFGGRIQPLRSHDLLEIESTI